MEYNTLKTINPTLDDVTLNSSIWLCSRLMPALGHENVSFPHYRIINNNAMRTADFTDLQITALLGMDDNETIVNLESGAGSLSYNGCWTVNNNTVIGRGHSSYGLICPFNTYNVGYRYKRNWRPSIVN